MIKEGVVDPPSVSSISRLLRGGSDRKDDRKDYSIHGILGGKYKSFYCKYFCSVDSESHCLMSHHKLKLRNLLKNNFI